jgi:hypothetical protein
MSADQLQALENRAYASWELGELLEAAELFFAAERLESELASTRGPFAKANRSILHKARGAYCLWDAGEFERARPILYEVALFDWKQGRLWGDRHDAEKAYSRLVLEAAASGNEDSFSALWVAASARGRELDYPFPTIVPVQKKLLAAALALKRKDVCRDILANLNAKLLAKHHDLQLLKAQAEALCSEA